MDTSNMLNLENLDSADPSDVLRQRNHMRALRRQSVMRARRESSSGSDAMHHLQLPHGSSRRGSTTSTISERDEDADSKSHPQQSSSFLPERQFPRGSKNQPPVQTWNSQKCCPPVLEACGVGLAACGLGLDVGLAKLFLHTSLETVLVFFVRRTVSV